MTAVDRPTRTVRRRARRGGGCACGPRSRWRWSAAVFVWFLPQFTSLSDVWTRSRHVLVQVAVLLLAALWNLATYQFLIVTTMPGLTFGQATVSTESTTAVSNTVVGGAAIALGLTYAMNSSWGFSRSRTSVSLLVSGLWNNFAKLGLPVLALVLLAFSAPPTAGRVIAGLLGVAALTAAVLLLGLLLRSEAAAARIGTGAARVASALRKAFGRGPVTGWDRPPRSSGGARSCCCAPAGTGSRSPPW